MFYLFDLIRTVINKPSGTTIGLRIIGYSLSAGITRTGIDIQGDELIGFDGHLGWSYSWRCLSAGLLFGWIFKVLVWRGGLRNWGGGRRA